MKVGISRAITKMHALLWRSCCLPVRRATARSVRCRAAGVSVGACVSRATGAAIAMGVTVGLGMGPQHMSAQCDADLSPRPLLNTLQVDDLTAVILDGYTIPMVPASLQTVIISEAVKSVVAKLEDDPAMASSKFTQHFQNALDHGLTEELMDELVADLNGVLDIPLLNEAAEDSLLR